MKMDFIVLPMVYIGHVPHSKKISAKNRASYHPIEAYMLLFYFNEMVRLKYRYNYLCEYYKSHHSFLPDFICFDHEDFTNFMNMRADQSFLDYVESLKS
jgi:hypothetical protein